MGSSSIICPGADPARAYRVESRSFVACFKTTLDGRDRLSSLAPHHWCRLGYKLYLPNEGSLAEAKQACKRDQQKGKQGCVHKSRQHSRHSCPNKARPLVSAWLTKSLSLFELLEEVWKSWWCLTCKFAKSALGQSKRTCSSSCTQCQLH